MDHLQAARPRAHLTETAQARAGRQIRGLSPAEVKEAQGEAL